MSRKKKCWSFPRFVAANPFLVTIITERLSSMSLYSEALLLWKRGGKMRGRENAKLWMIKWRKAFIDFFFRVFFFVLRRRRKLSREVLWLKGKFLDDLWQFEETWRIFWVVFKGRDIYVKWKMEELLKVGSIFREMSTNWSVYSKYPTLWVSILRKLILKHRENETIRTKTSDHWSVMDGMVFKMFKILWRRGQQLFIERKSPCKVVGPAPSSYFPVVTASLKI
jgi:hypothetical protein